MPFEKLENIMLQIQLKYKQAGEEFSGHARKVRNNMDVVKQWGEQNFVDTYKDLAEVLFWLKLNEPDYTQLASPIFQDIPESFYPLIFDEMYSCEIRNLDPKKLSMDAVSQFVDVNKVGTGNVLIDIAVRSFKFASEIEDPEIIENVVALLPDMVAKLDQIRRLNPYKLERRYDDKHPKHLSPFYPKVPLYLGDFDNIHNQAKHTIARLICNDRVAAEIFSYAIFACDGGVNGESFWSLLIKNNYSAEEQVKFTAITQAEHSYITQVKAHRDANQNDPLGHLRFSLTLARDICLQQVVTVHLDYAIKLAVSEMSDGHTYYLATEELTGNAGLHDFLHSMLSIPNTDAGNKAFAGFLGQISFSSPPKLGVKFG